MKQIIITLILLIVYCQAYNISSREVFIRGVNNTKYPLNSFVFTSGMNYEEKKFNLDIKYNTPMALQEFQIKTTYNKSEDWKDTMEMISYVSVSQDEVYISRCLQKDYLSFQAQKEYFLINLTKLDGLNETLNRKHVAKGHLYVMNKYNKTWRNEHLGRNEDGQYDMKCYARKWSARKYPEFQKKMYQRLKNALLEKSEIDFGSDVILGGRLWSKQYKDRYEEVVYEVLDYTNHDQKVLNMQNIIIPKSYLKENKAEINLKEGNDLMLYSNILRYYKRKNKFKRIKNDVYRFQTWHTGTYSKEIIKSDNQYYLQYEVDFKTLKKNLEGAKVEADVCQFALLDVLEYDQKLGQREATFGHVASWVENKQSPYPQSIFTVLGNTVPGEDIDENYHGKEQMGFYWMTQVPIKFNSFKPYTFIDSKPKIYFTCFSHGYEHELDLDIDILKTYYNTNIFIEIPELKEKITKKSAKNKKIKVPDSMRRRNKNKNRKEVEGVDKNRKEVEGVDLTEEKIENSNKVFLKVIVIFVLLMIIYSYFSKKTDVKGKGKRNQKQNKKKKAKNQKQD